MWISKTDDYGRTYAFSEGVNDHEITCTGQSKICIAGGAGLRFNPRPQDRQETCEPSGMRWPSGTADQVVIHDGFGHRHINVSPARAGHVGRNRRVATALFS